MPFHGYGDDLSSCFPPSVPPQFISTQDLPMTPADTVSQIVPDTKSMAMEHEILDSINPFDFDLPPASPQIDFSEIMDFAAPAADARPCSKDHAGDLLPGANAGCTSATTEIQQQLEEEEEDGQRRRRVFDSWKKDVEQHLFGQMEADPLSTAPDDKLLLAPALAPALKNGRHACSADHADMLPGTANAAASTGTQPKPRRLWLDDVWLAPLPVAVVGGAEACEFRTSVERAEAELVLIIMEYIQQNCQSSLDLRRFAQGIFDISWLSIGVREPYAFFKDFTWSIVRFTGPDSKSRRPHQPRWRETGMKAMRASADPSLPQEQQQQQPYIGLKKTLELDDDGNGNKWHAHEYTALLPSDDDDAAKLIPAEFSLRVEFKDDKPQPRPEPEPEPEPPPSSLKRSRGGVPKDGPKIPVKSHVWDHMTKVHVKVTTNPDGSERKKPHYKVMFAICDHCDHVFNADSGHGTHNQLNHLQTCNCNCCPKLTLPPPPAPEDDPNKVAWSEQLSPEDTWAQVCLGSSNLGREKIQRRNNSLKEAIHKDLTKKKLVTLALGSYFTCMFALCGTVSCGQTNLVWDGIRLPPEHSDISTNTPCSIVRFTRDSKDRKTQQGCWKQKSMAGMRADPPGGQGYVSLKRTLQLHDVSGALTKWRAYEYTPLLPSDDDGTKLIPADFSLRVVFKDEKPQQEPELPCSRGRGSAPNDGPKIPVKSHIWDHMTKVHVKVFATNKDGSQRKKPHYKVMYAICHHCHQVFNADSGHGTNNLSKHLKGCKRKFHTLAAG